MSDSAAPGWYHAEGDPPNTERYWDGSAWTDGPRPIGGDIAQTPQPETPSFDMPSDDTPSSSTPGTDMPVTGASAADTEIAGMGQSMPSMDDPSPAPGGFSSVTPGPSDLPGSAPGGFSSSTPPAGMPPTNMPPTNMPPMGAAPGGGFGPPPGTPGQPAFPGAPVAAPGAMFAESSQATLGLVLSILGLFCCITAPFGAYFGWAEKKAIDEGRRDPSNRGQAVAALVIGGIVTGLGALSVLAIVVLGAIGG